jgi:Spy/CpxP family protein refolding chaperone
MKITWKLTATVLLATAMVGSAYAQARGPQGAPPSKPGTGGRMNGPDPKQMEERAKKTVHEQLKPALKLTAAQEKKILALYLKSNKESMALFKDKKMSREDMMKKFKAMRDKRDKALNAILTPAQQKLYKKWQTERRNRFGGPGMRGGPGGPGGRGGPGGPPMRGIPGGPGGPPKGGPGKK